ncbi:MAG: TolC family protein [Thermodesulfobacteriota bacterium]
MAAIRQLICGLCALLLCGCIAVPRIFAPRVTNVPVPAVSAPGHRPPSPSPAEKRSLSLDQCIELARRNNPGLAAGTWDVQSLWAQRNVASSQRWPQISTKDSYRNYVQPQRLQAARLNAEPGMFSSSILSVDLTLNMPLFTGGRIRSEISSAELAALAAENRLARTWEELIFNISSAFYTILGQRRLIESLNFSRDVLAKHKRRVLDMMAADKAARVDVLRIEVRIADLDQRLARETNVLEIQKRLLAALIGISDRGVPVDIQGELVLGHTAPALDGALAMAFAERGDYRAARASLDAQAMKLRSTRAALWPTISVDGAFGLRAAAGIDDNGVAYTKRLNEAQIKPLRGPWPNPDSNLPVGSLGVVLDYPIFDGGRISSQIRDQEAKLASGQAQLRKLELQIRLDVETALLNVSSARQRVQATRKSIEQSKESFRIEQEKYDLGKGTITDVLDAQSAMLEAESNYYRALADYNIALAQLGLATGEKR